MLNRRQNTRRCKKNQHFRRRFVDLLQNRGLPWKYSGTASVKVSYLSLQKATDTLKREVKAWAMETNRNKLFQAKQDNRCIYGMPLYLCLLSTKSKRNVRENIDTITGVSIKPHISTKTMSAASLEHSNGPSASVNTTSATKWETSSFSKRTCSMQIVC